MHFPRRKFRQGILPLVRERLAPLLFELFEGCCSPVCAFEFCAGEDDCPFRPVILASVVRCQIVAQTTSLLGKLSSCFPLIAFSNFPFNVGFLFWLGYSSSPHYFVPDSEVSSSHRLINMKSYRCLQSWEARLPIVSNSFLVIQCQYSLKLNRIPYIWLL